MNLVCLAHPGSLVAQWLQRPTGVQKVVGFIPSCIMDSDFLLRPTLMAQLTLHIILSIFIIIVIIVNLKREFNIIQIFMYISSVFKFTPLLFKFVGFCRRHSMVFCKEKWTHCSLFTHRHQKLESYFIA